MQTNPVLPGLLLVIDALAELGRRVQDIRAASDAQVSQTITSPAAGDTPTNEGVTAHIVLSKHKNGGGNDE